LNKTFIQLPLVSVVAISYNQERYVEETLNSIKAQTYPNIQLIISDDGSTDNTKKIIAEWIAQNYSSAIFLNHSKNRGVNQNYNSTIPCIKGEYVKLIGCDDVLLPDTIEIIMQKFFELPSDYGVIYGDMFRIDENSNLIDEVGLIDKRGHPVFSGDVYQHMIKKPFITAASIIFKKEVLDKLKCFNEKIFYEDHDFYLRASKVCKFFFMPQGLVKYRVHAKSLINSSSKIKYFHNVFFVYLTNFDERIQYKKIYTERLLFCIKNFYALKFKRNSLFALKAFFKTGDLTFIKFAIASLPFYFSDNDL